MKLSSCPYAYLHTTSWRRIGEWKYIYEYTHVSSALDVSFSFKPGQLYPPETSLTVPIWYEAGWAPGPVWTLWRKQTSLCGWMEFVMSRESSVNIVTSLRAERLMNVGYISIKSKENSCFRLRSLETVAGVVNQPRREAQHRPLRVCRVSAFASCCSGVRTGWRAERKPAYLQRAACGKRPATWQAGYLCVPPVTPPSTRPTCPASRSRESRVQTFPSLTFRNCLCLLIFPPPCVCVPQTIQTQYCYMKQFISHNMI
jgi:hypothetical protein